MESRMPPNHLAPDEGRNEPGSKGVRDFFQASVGSVGCLRLGQLSRRSVMDVHVRGIDPEVWRELRIEALRQGISVAHLIEQVWREWCAMGAGSDRKAEV